MPLKLAQNGWQEKEWRSTCDCVESEGDASRCRRRRDGRIGEEERQRQSTAAVGSAWAAVMPRRFEQVAGGDEGDDKDDGKKG